MTLLAPTEIRALARIIDELDYYQILHLDRGAPQAAVKQAYHATARAFHPDANGHLEPAMARAVGRIAKRVTEAYSVLRDVRRRKVYDEQLGRGDAGLRMQIADAEKQAGRRATQELEGRTPNGRRYFGLARSDIERRDLSAALRNLQTALAFEPDNTLFQKKLAEVRERLR